MIVVNSRFLTQPITGVQRFSIELSLQLKKKLGSQVLFVSPSNILHHDLAEILEVKVIGRRTGHAWEQFDLPLFLNQMGKPLLLCMGNTAPVVYRNKVSILHDVTFLRYPQTFSKKFLMFYRLVIPWVLLTSRHVFTVSNFSLEEIVSSYKIDRNKISVVYNAVDQKFACVEDKGLSADKYLFTVSSIKVNKNFGVAVNAFKIIQKRIPDLKLYIMGDMNADSFRNMGNLIEECSKNPNIKLLERVSDNDLIRYYSNAVAFIFPSLYEGFGIPVLEAQACGCPVISSNSSSLPEILGDSALMCDPNNTNEFANAVLKLVNHKSLKEILIDKGYENIKRFSWEKSAEKLLGYL